MSLVTIKLSANFPTCLEVHQERREGGRRHMTGGTSAGCSGAGYKFIFSPAARKFVIHWQMGADTVSWVSLEWRTSGMMLFSAKLFQFYGEAKLHFWWCHVVIYTGKIHKHKLYKATYLTAIHQPDIMSTYTWIAGKHRERVKSYLWHLPPQCCP